MNGNILGVAGGPNVQSAIVRQEWPVEEGCSELWFEFVAFTRNFIFGFQFSCLLSGLELEIISNQFADTQHQPTSFFLKLKCE